MGPDSRQPAKPRQVHFLVLALAPGPVIVRRQGGGAMTLGGTVPTDRASRTDWVAVAAELVPAFAARAAAHDVDDRFVFENYAELRRRRIFSAAVPAELGGGGASHAEMCDVLRTLAHGCSSTALALSMHTHQVLIPAWRWRHERAPVEGLLSRLAADELILASSGGSDWLAGSGRADTVDGGCRAPPRRSHRAGAGRRHGHRARGGTAGVAVHGGGGQSRAGRSRHHERSDDRPNTGGPQRAPNRRDRDGGGGWRGVLPQRRPRATVPRCAGRALPRAAQRSPAALRRSAGARRRHRRLNRLDVNA